MTLLNLQGDVEPPMKIASGTVLLYSCSHPCLIYIIMHLVSDLYKHDQGCDMYGFFFFFETLVLLWQ